jgi:DNA-binding NarL/FixJ family response regulator
MVVLEPYPPKLALCRRMKELDLSKHQSEIILEIMRGRTNKEIALKLGLALQTVKDHLYTIFQELKVRNRAELIIHVMGNLSFLEDE